MERKVKILVEGRVQGVGYRYFVLQKALELDIKGYVKNLWNGSVEVLAIGAVSDIDAFLSLLKEGPHLANVRSLGIEEMKNTENYHLFEIRQ